MGSSLPDEERQRRVTIFANSKNDREAAEKIGITKRAFNYWRRLAGIPRHKAEREQTKTDYPSPDAHIYKRMLRQMFMPTPDSAIGLPGVNVRTKIRYVDRAI
jgi:hypothetical protein